MRREVDIFLSALIFFTRIRVPGFLNYTYDPGYLQKSSRYFPVMGWIVGGVAGALFWLFAQIWPAPVAVLLSMIASILLTGAFHEDGWADVCDGFGGGFTQEQVLTIMKDSRLGTYGTIGLVGVLGLKATSLIYLAPGGSLPLMLLAAHSVSRLASTTLIYGLDYVRADLESKAKPLATRISLPSMLLATLFGLLPMLLLPPIFWIGLVGVAGVTLFLARWYVARLGGYTGDCLGGVQQITELILYLSWLLI